MGEIFGDVVCGRQVSGEECARRLVWWGVTQRRSDFEGMSRKHYQVPPPKKGTVKCEMDDEGSWLLIGVEVVW